MAGDDGLLCSDGRGDLVKIVDADFLVPILDILPRLWSRGFRTSEQDGRWWLWRSDGEGIVSGATFRELCVNIVLAGL